jgi:integrase
MWFATWWEDGHRRGKTLGSVNDMTKTNAQLHLDEILRPLNAQRNATPLTFGELVNNVVLPWAERKWKQSTNYTTKERITTYLVTALGDRPLRAISRQDLQGLLDKIAENGLSQAVLGHLRWDLRMIGRVAVAEGHLDRNPAELLHTPRGKTYEKRFLTKNDAIKLLAAFGLRERIMIKLAGVSGMRPGEIVGLQWADVKDDAVHVKRRVYRHKIDTPKTSNSVRRAALPPSLVADLREWRSLYPAAQPENWVFPSEHGGTPVSPGNVWRRNINPILQRLGLSWVNYQVLRRSCSSLLNDLGVEGKIVADQLGHTLDVNQNVYTRVAIERQRDAVSKLDASLRPLESRGVLN